MPPPPLDSLFLEYFDQCPLRALVSLPSNQGHHLGPLGLGEDVGNMRHEMNVALDGLL